jgi:triosephosphate isomerase
MPPHSPFPLSRLLFVSTAEEEAQHSTSESWPLYHVHRSLSSADHWHLSILDSNTEVVVAPPSLYLLLTREHLSSNIEVAAQNVFDRPNGAFTGEISVAQLKDSNIRWTLLGHSERRTILREEDEFVACKSKAALDGGIGVILCCGESLEEREAGTTVDVVTRQLAAVNNSIGKDGWKNVVIAYEPIWAIGTGKVATTGMNAFWRAMNPQRHRVPDTNHAFGL